MLVGAKVGKWLWKRFLLIEYIYFSTFVKGQPFLLHKKCVFIMSNDQYAGCKSSMQIITETGSAAVDSGSCCRHSVQIIER